MQEHIGMGSQGDANSKPRSPRRSDSSLRRSFAHELRNALSPIASALNLLRLSDFDPDTSRLTTETIERALRRALAVVDAFVPAEAGEPAATASAGAALPAGGLPDRKETPAQWRGTVRAEQPPTGARPCGIMIVDDSAEVRKAFRDPLLTLGYSVSEANDAEEALRRIGGESPDVALIDVHLPGMNGYRLAAEIRARTGSATRLIMLSAMTMDSATRRLARQVGFDDCLDKMAGPLELHRLLRTGALADPDSTEES